MKYCSRMGSSAASSERGSAVAVPRNRMTNTLEKVLIISNKYFKEDNNRAGRKSNGRLNVRQGCMRRENEKD